METEKWARDQMNLSVRDVVTSGIKDKKNFRESAQSVPALTGTPTEDCQLTQREVKRLFDYRDGQLVWRVKIAARAKIGNCAGCITEGGYTIIAVRKKLYFAHRLIWLWHNGYSPENCIDHIDRDRGNNRIENLRAVSHSCNTRNSKKSKNNTSGVKGICYSRKEGKWLSRIVNNNIRTSLGYFCDFTEAVAHRLAAEQCLNWESCDYDSSANQYIKGYLNDTKNRS
jgi:hypothetical protein